MVDQAQIDAMAELMRKMNANTVTTMAESVVAESKNNPDLGVAVEAQRTDRGVTVSRYEIKTNKKVVHEGLEKTFYSIVDNRTYDTLYDDIGLFESAMGIVKHLLYTEDHRKVKRLVELDASYVGLLLETYGYKKRLKRLDESSLQYDIASAKYSNTRTKLGTVKKHILKAL